MPASEMMSYDRILTLRPEVVDDQQLIDMVDLAHVSAAPAGGAQRSRSGQRRAGMKAAAPATERLSDPQSFFDLTYPTEDVRQTLRAIALRASAPAEVPGTILLSGRYGLGKSHVMLAAHHALTAPAVARRWAERWQLEPLDLPDDALVVTRNFISRTTESLWEVFFEVLGRQDLGAAITTYPDGETIQRALGERPVFLILDELERWYDALTDETLKSRNRNFIQAMTEVAARDGRLTLITSVLGERQEPAETIRRVRPAELTFRSSQDRERVILFRLFCDHDEHDRDAVARVIAAHRDVYQQAGIDALDAYTERMRATYPFTPELLDLLTRKVPNLGGFQNTRGTLRFLARVVQATHGTRAIIGSGDLPITDEKVVTALANLDTEGGDVVRRALGDNHAAVQAGLPFKGALFSAILFYSIADPSHPGATEAELLRAILAPGDNPNDLRDALTRVRSLAFNLHVQDDRYLFRTVENPHARINAVALGPQVTDSAIAQTLLDVIADRWNAKANTVLYSGDLDATRQGLRKLGRVRPRCILSTQALEPATRLQLQNLDEKRNVVLLIEPRVRQDRLDERYNVLRDRRHRDRARRIQACKLLLESHPAAEAARVYQRVASAERSHLGREVAERYGRYVAWHRGGADPAEVDDDWYELGLFDDFTAAGFLGALKRDYSGQAAIKARVAALWPAYRHRKARFLIDHFDASLGEPIPYEEDMVPRALRSLVTDHALSLHGPDGAVYNHLNIHDLSVEALPECVLDAPVSVVPDPPEPERRYTHDNVAGQHEAAASCVRLRWTYPARDAAAAARGFRTLVQRYANRQGMEVGRAYPVDLDRTQEANRFIGDGELFDDREGLIPGAWYYYYVFLIDDRGDSRQAVLSRVCDVHIPQASERPRGVIRVPPQPSVNQLHAQLERAVMSPANMRADSRARKLTLELHGVVNHADLRALVSDLGVPDDDLEVRAEVTVNVRGRLGRQKILTLIPRLPRLENVHYSATIHLAERDDDADA